MENTSKLLVCKHCHNKFSLNSVDIKTKSVELPKRKLVVQYFKCSKCHKYYFVLVLDDKSKEMMQEYQVLMKWLYQNAGFVKQIVDSKETTDSDKELVSRYENNLAKYKKLKSEIKSRHLGLRSRYSSDIIAYLSSEKSQE